MAIRAGNSSVMARSEDLPVAARGDSVEDSSLSHRTLHLLVGASERYMLTTKAATTTEKELEIPLSLFLLFCCLQVREINCYFHFRLNESAN